MTSGAPLAGVWPPALPDELRRAVEVDAGAGGFSHVVAHGARGPVLLVAADAIVVWVAPGEVRRLGHDEVEVSRRGVRGTWTIVAPSPAPREDDPAAERSDAGAPPPPPLAFVVSKDMAARVRECAQRAQADRDNATAQVFAGIELAAARVRAPEPPTPAPAPELARPEPIERAGSSPDDLVRHTIERASAPAAPHAFPEAVPGTVARGPSTDAAEGSPEAIAGVVVSVLDPTGYVRIQPRDILVASTSLGGPLLVGDRVTLVARAGDTMLARPEDPSAMAESRR